MSESSCSPSPQLGPTQSRSAKKHRKWPWVTGGVVALLLVIGIATSGGGTDPGTATVEAPVTTTVDPAAEAASRSAEAASRSAGASRERAAAEASAASAEAEAKRLEAEAAAASRAEAVNRRITYAVSTTGPGILSVTYVTDGFNIAQETDVPGAEWSKTVEASGDTLGWNMNAQNEGGGTITCTIMRGDRIVTENTSSGDYAMVTCSLM